MKIQEYLQYFCQDNGSKSGICISLNEGSLEIMSKVPKKNIIFCLLMKKILFWGNRNDIKKK